MSLLRRVERAQQAAAERAAAEAQAAEDPSALTVAAPVAVMAITPPPPPPPPVAPPPPPVAIPITGGRASMAAGARIPTREEMLRDIRIRLQEQVVNAFDTLLDDRRRTSRRRSRASSTGRSPANGFAVTRDERERLVDELANDVTGFGPLEPLLSDETITEVMVNGPNHIYIERGGKIEQGRQRLPERRARPPDHRPDHHPDGPPDRRDEPARRRPPARRLARQRDRRAAVARRAGHHRPEVLEAAVHGRGPDPVRDRDAGDVRVPAGLHRGAAQPVRLGRHGLRQDDDLNVLSSFIPNDERIVTIEDAAELQLRQDHVITLESRPPNLEGEGEITIRHLLRNAMHMRPDRIIVGECRSGEALDMLQAMTTGHDGSLSTGHANTPKDMLRRLETMVLMTGYELPLRAIREQIASAVDLIVHTARLKDGTRKVVNITEVYGIEDDEILTQDIFAFEQTGVNDDGKIDRRAPADRRSARRSWTQFEKPGVKLPPGEFGIPPEDPKPSRLSRTKGRWGVGESRRRCSPTTCRSAIGKAVKAGGMVYVSSVGPDRSGDRADRRRPRSRARRASAWRTSRRSSRRRAARSTRSSGRTGRSAIRPSSTCSTRSGSAGSRATARSASGR